MKFLTGLLMVLTVFTGYSQKTCEKAKSKAQAAFDTSIYTLFSSENLPAENTYRYVLKQYYDVNWQFIGADSVDYYFRYNTRMENLLSKKLGFNIEEKAFFISDSLENLENWNKKSEFPGGLRKLHKLIIEKLAVSNKQLENPTGNKILIDFIVDKNGSVVEPKIRKGINEKLNQNLIDIMSKLPSFSPEYQLGKPIKSKWSIPFYIHYK